MPFKIKEASCWGKIKLFLTDLSDNDWPGYDSIKSEKMTLSMLIAYCSKPYQVTDPEYTKKSHFENSLWWKKVWNRKGHSNWNNHFYFDSCHSLAKETAENTTHNADATHEFRIEKQHKLMISL